MGSWNKTCGISNIHIRAGEQVYVFALEQNNDRHDRCYATAFWKPVMLPFLSVYDDYGGGESSHKNINYILAGLKELLVKMPLGDNEIHDIEVSADRLNEDLFFEAVHEGRLKIRDYYNEEHLVDFVMLRADVVDSICENWGREMYVGANKGTTGWDNAYISYKFADIVAAVPGFLDRVEKELLGPADSDLEEMLPVKLRVKYVARGLSEVFDYEESNLVSAYLRGIDDYRFSRIVRPTDIVVDLLASGNRLEAEAVLVDVLRASFINSFMEVSRKNWAPAGHEGSQSQEHSPYRVLCNAITQVLDAEKAAYDE